jgi:hypothetical protein
MEKEDFLLPRFSMGINILEYFLILKILKIKTKNKKMLSKLKNLFKTEKSLKDKNISEDIRLKSKLKKNTKKGSCSGCCGGGGNGCDDGCGGGSECCDSGCCSNGCGSDCCDSGYYFYINYK